jgi:hypothetical protein
MNGETESPMPPDLFDLLDISLREDSYTALLKAAMTTTPTVSQAVFQSLAQPGLPTPRHVEVRFRREFPDGDRYKAECKDRPDLLLVGIFESGAPYWVLIESKITSGEGPGQCARYKGVCEKAARAQAISGFTLYYLTLLGRWAPMPEFIARSHTEVARQLAPLVANHTSDAFQLAWRAYLKRLQHLEKSAPSEDTLLLAWLADKRLFATSSVLAAHLGHGFLAPGWDTFGAYWVFGAKEAYFVHASQPGWKKLTYERGGEHRLAECFELHLELELPPKHQEGSLPLRLQCMTRPYMPASVMKNLPEGERREFNEWRERVRGVVHAALGEQHTRWRRTGHLLQLARAHLNVDACTTVGAFRDAYRELAEQIAEPVNRALQAVARRRSE